MRNLAELYKNLSPNEREKYDKKSKEAFNEYNKKKMEYLWVTFWYWKNDKMFLYDL